MELKELFRNAGIIGAGGAGFPSYAKLAEGADTLLVNGAECEPLLYTDYVILKRELDTVLTGIEEILSESPIKKAYICIKSHTAKRLSFKDGEELSDNIKIKVLPDVYPMGDEVSLIYEATGRLVNPGHLPISVGVIVYNVETLYNLGRAILGHGGVYMKWLTVGGDIDNPTVVRVPVGTAVADVFAWLGINVKEGYSVIDGGPSMGKLINHERASVTKTTKSLLILPDSIEAVRTKSINQRAAVARAETACCQCTRCTDMCPRALLGYPLEPHKMVRTAMGAAVTLPQMVISATLCSGCGVCESLACSQGISPKAVINNYKALLAEHKMRYFTKESVEPGPEREYRMIPSEKWAATLGVARFDRVCEWGGELTNVKRVEIPLTKHIGAPSIPTVNSGDFVTRGQVIAEPGEGLSVPQHASIDGAVTVLSRKIIIDKV